MATPRQAGVEGRTRSNGAASSAFNGLDGATDTPASVKTNGARKETASTTGTNGHTQNGLGRPSPRYQGHDREEVSRLLLQALTDLGYHDAAATLSRESGFTVESESVAAFRKAVLTGEWTTAERLLLGAVGSGSGDDNRHQGIVLNASADKDTMRFYLKQQKYLELLERRDTVTALTVLREEVTPLSCDDDEIGLLSSLLMCRDPTDIMHKIKWDGAEGKSRQSLLTALSNHISPSVMLPEHRLADIMTKTLLGQVGSCLYHNADSPPSLLTDHCCDREGFPDQLMLELDKHSGEVWQIKFSHDGTRLASCGQDRHVIIWDTVNFDVLLKLDGHENGVGNLAWSPDDTLLVTCGRDRFARIYDTNTGLLSKLIERFKEPVSSCVWMKDGESFILGSFDKERPLTQWDSSGDRLHTWTRKHRVEDLAISGDELWLCAMDEERTIHVYDVTTRELRYDISLDIRPTSINFAQNRPNLLVGNVKGDVISYDVTAKGKVMRKYLGAIGGDCLIRSGLGGLDESFVVSGSEDGNFLVWQRHVAVTVLKVKAHESRCNAVAWSPTDPALFATCGDDGKIKIWSDNRQVPVQPRRGAQSVAEWYRELGVA